jgi:hypothetical protein
MVPPYFLRLTDTRLTPPLPLLLAQVLQHHFLTSEMVLRPPAAASPTASMRGRSFSGRIAAERAAGPGPSSASFSRDSAVDGLSFREVGRWWSAQQALKTFVREARR